MIQSRTLGLAGFTPQTISLTCVSDIRRPHRLGAQDGALSRPKLGFESPWGHKERAIVMMALFISNWRLRRGDVIQIPGVQRRVIKLVTLLFYQETLY